MTAGAREVDPMLRRFERTQRAACLVMAAIALAAGRVDVALGVAAGGLLMAFSYRAIKGGVDAMLEGNRTPVSADAPAKKAASRTARRRMALLARFVGRYALLALAAYVMLACLHTHPVGLLIGAASPVVAAAAEAVRVLRTSPPGQS